MLPHEPVFGSGFRTLPVIVSEHWPARPQSTCRFYCDFPPVRVVESGLFFCSPPRYGGLACRSFAGLPRVGCNPSLDFGTRYRDAW